MRLKKELSVPHLWLQNQVRSLREAETQARGKEHGFALTRCRGSNGGSVTYQLVTFSSYLTSPKLHPPHKQLELLSWIARD